MSDYISKSALIEALEKSKEDNRHITGEGYGVHIQEHRYLIHLVKKQPTLDETEIIRKVFERVLDKLRDRMTEYSDGTFHLKEFDTMAEAIEIVKEECGINE